MDPQAKDYHQLVSILTSIRIKVRIRKLDQDTTWKAVRDNCDTIGSDHAPHNLKEKIILKLHRNT